MTIQAELETILKGLPDVRVNQVSGLWQVSVGGLSGARKNGRALARDLRKQYEFIRDRERPEPAPEPVVLERHEPQPKQRIVTVSDPAQDALIEHLRAELDAAREKVKVTESAPPTDLADLIDWSAPPKERQEALLVKLREVAGMIGLAEDRGGRAPAELYARRDRLESGIHFNRPTLTETI